MNIEAELAQTEVPLPNGHQFLRLGASGAAAIMPLVRRAQAEALREAARFLRSPDNPQRSDEFRRESYSMDDAGYLLFARADRIEQNSEGNET